MCLKEQNCRVTRPDKEFKNHQRKIAIFSQNMISPFRCDSKSKDNRMVINANGRHNKRNILCFLFKATKTRTNGSRKSNYIDFFSNNLQFEKIVIVDDLNCQINRPRSTISKKVFWAVDRNRLEAI